eukprot:gene16095-biopygen12720
MQQSGYILHPLVSFLPWRCRGAAVALPWRERMPYEAVAKGQLGGERHSVAYIRGRYIRRLSGCALWMIPAMGAPLSPA